MGLVSKAWLSLAIGVTVSSSSLSGLLSVHPGRRQKSSLRLLAGSIVSTVQILLCYSLNRSNHLCPWEFIGNRIDALALRGDLNFR